MFHLCKYRYVTLYMRAPAAIEDSIQLGKFLKSTVCCKHGLKLHNKSWVLLMAVEKHENVPFEMSSCWKMFLKLEFSVRNVFRRKMASIFGNGILARIQFFFPQLLAFWQILKYFPRQGSLKMQNFKFLSNCCFRIKHLFLSASYLSFREAPRKGVSLFAVKPYWKGDGPCKTHP